MTFPAFNSCVCDNGYRWWYLDAVSDDGAQALTVIVFVGSVFSPYYAWARKSGAASADAHCAINIALYGHNNCWTMTERAANSIERSANYYRIGPSSVRVENQELIYAIDEIAVPLPQRVVGEIRVGLNPITTKPISIDSTEQHQWQALAPKTRINVNFVKPDVKWSGNAYVDTNWGTEPMEDAFISWNWSRAHLDCGDTVVQYDVERRDGTDELKTLRFDQRTASPVTHASLTDQRSLPVTRYWRQPRLTRTEQNAEVSNLKTLEDTPFYSRSSFNTVIEGHDAVSIHESIDFDRIRKSWVQHLLPFRMPRITRPS